jgi:RHS repeat-associated protein
VFKPKRHQILIEIGLDETDFRRYDANLGRFTGVDALAEMYQPLTPYHYAANNPLVFNDPSGLCPDCPNFGSLGGFMDGFVWSSSVDSKQYYWNAQESAWIEEIPSISVIAKKMTEEEKRGSGGGSKQKNTNIQKAGFSPALLGLAGIAGTSVMVTSEVSMAALAMPAFAIGAPVALLYYGVKNDLKPDLSHYPLPIYLPNVLDNQGWFIPKASDLVKPPLAIPITDVVSDTKEHDLEIVRVRHHTSPRALKDIKSSMKVNAGRGGGVHVELSPFHPDAREAAKAFNAFGNGAYVDFDVPRNLLIPHPNKISPIPNVKPYIVTTGLLPYPLIASNPKFVNYSWWRFW